MNTAIMWEGNLIPIWLSIRFSGFLSSFVVKTLWIQLVAKKTDRLIDIFSIHGVFPRPSHILRKSPILH